MPPTPEPSAAPCPPDAGALRRFLSVAVTPDAGAYAAHEPVAATPSAAPCLSRGAHLRSVAGSSPRLGHRLPAGVVFIYWMMSRMENMRKQWVIKFKSLLRDPKKGNKSKRTVRANSLTAKALEVVGKYPTPVAKDDFGMVDGVCI